jgi:hypothetical protein
MTVGTMLTVQPDRKLTAEQDTQAGDDLLILVPDRDCAKCQDDSDTTSTNDVRDWESK